MAEIERRAQQKAEAWAAKSATTTSSSTSRYFGSSKDGIEFSAPSMNGKESEHYHEVSVPHHEQEESFPGGSVDLCHNSNTRATDSPEVMETTTGHLNSMEPIDHSTDQIRNAEWSCKQPQDADFDFDSAFGFDTGDWASSQPPLAARI